jgi:hypothetical protein
VNLVPIVDGINSIISEILELCVAFSETSESLSEGSLRRLPIRELVSELLRKAAPDGFQRRAILLSIFRRSACDHRWQAAVALMPLHSSSYKQHALQASKK